MHTATRSAEKCWLILLRTAWRLSSEAIQFARSIEGIQRARVLVSSTRIRLVRTFSLRCLPLFFLHDVFHFFSKSSKTVSLRCSFCFHVNSNRATAHSSHERRLSASCDIRSMRIVLTVPCQYHHQKSPVMPLSCNCRIVSLRCYHTFFAVPALVRLFGLHTS